MSALVQECLAAVRSDHRLPQIYMQEADLLLDIRPARRAHKYYPHRDATRAVWQMSVRSSQIIRSAFYDGFRSMVVSLLLIVGRPPMHDWFAEYIIIHARPAIAQYPCHMRFRRGTSYDLRFMEFANRHF